MNTDLPRYARVPLLVLEGQWREELTIEALRRAFPEQDGLQVNLTGGEVFMRKDILSVLDVFREKGYTCGYLTTNGTIITEDLASSTQGVLVQLPRRAVRDFGGEAVVGVLTGF